jgi:hypothetical protein
MEDTLERWRSEKTAAYLTDVVAAWEPDPAKAHLFNEMARAAEDQAAILAKSLKPIPAFAPSLRSRITAFLIRIFGPRAMKPVLAASKVRGVSVYGGKIEEGHPWPTSVEDIGRRHKTYGGGTLRAGVFGVNDGLVSNTCLVMGVAGAAAEPSVLVLTALPVCLPARLLLGRPESFTLDAVAEGDVRASDRSRAHELSAIRRRSRRSSPSFYAARGLPLAQSRDVAAKDDRPS